MSTSSRIPNTADVPLRDFLGGEPFFSPVYVLNLATICIFSDILLQL
jgi:hypothetical protein